MVKKKIYPTDHRKYFGGSIEKKGNRSFLATFDSRNKLIKRVTRRKSGFKTYKKALRFIKNLCKQYQLYIKNMIYERDDHCECMLTQGKRMLFDKEDIKKVQEHIIYAHQGVSGIFYASTHLDREISFANIIMDHDPSTTTITIDHSQPGDGLNNRKSNLRLADRSEQAINQRMQGNNTSGFTGVIYDVTHDRWRAIWMTEKGKRRSKSFACKKYGEARAKEMAVAYRRKIVAETKHYHILRRK